MGAKYDLSNGYTVSSNTYIEDKTLSCKAKGILLFILSKPDGWNFSAERIANCNKDGIEAIKSGLIELEEHSYLKRSPSKDDKGRIDGYDYYTNGGNTLDGYSAGVKPSEGKHAKLVNTDIVNTDIVNTDIVNTEYSKKEEEINSSKKNSQNIVDYLLFDREIYSESLKQAIVDWLEMRKKIKKPATDRAIELSINDAIKYAKESKCTPVEIFNQSTKNSWQGLFPLKDFNKRTSMQRPGVRDIDHSEWDGVERLERI